jgi:hypothetical protein
VFPVGFARQRCEEKLQSSLISKTTQAGLIDIKNQQMPRVRSELPSACRRSAHPLPDSFSLEYPHANASSLSLSGRRRLQQQ